MRYSQTISKSLVEAPAPEVKRPTPETDDSHPSSAKIKTADSYASPRPIVFLIPYICEPQKRHKKRRSSKARRGSVHCVINTDYSPDDPSNYAGFTNDLIVNHTETLPQRT
jgi:hypothetical protein